MLLENVSRLLFDACTKRPGHFRVFICNGEFDLSGHMLPINGVELDSQIIAFSKNICAHLSGTWIAPPALNIGVPGLASLLGMNVDHIAL